MDKKQTDSLPLTRRSQILYFIKEEPSLLFFVNFTAAFFFVPLAFVFTWGILSYSSIAIKEGVTNSECFASILYPSLALVPATMISGIGMCGVYSVISRLILRSTSPYSTFWKGIKDNWRQFLLTYSIVGILLSLLFINIGVYYYVDLSVTTKLVSLIVVSILLVLFLFIKHFVLFQITLFNNSYLLILRNSIGFIGKRFLYNLLALLISNVMYVIILFTPGWFKVIPIVLIAAYWIMFSSLVNYVICIDTLELKLPRELTQEFYHRGLDQDEEPII